MSEPKTPERESGFYEQLAELLDADRPPHELDAGPLLAAFPEFAVEIHEFVEGEARLSQLAAPLRQCLSMAETPASSLGDTAEDDRHELPDLPEYEIVREVARGGMGIVYEARHHSLDRTVALKVIGLSRRSKRNVKRFQQEARRSAGLDHAHIVPVYEVGEHGGCHYFTMRLMSGGSLAERIRARPLEPRASVEILASIARGVHFAHQRGILHRDIKPGNILFDENDVPQIADFGLASEIVDGEAQDRSVTLAGTPLYMSPEQASSGTELTTATDVYGLGVVLYEALTGEPPFRGSNLIDTLLEVRSREPKAPRDLDAKVDIDLNTICLKCLEKQPSQRYGSAEAFADDLNRWLGHQPILARRCSVPHRLMKWIKRSPAIAASALLSTVAVVGLILGLAIATFLVSRERDEKSVALAERSAALRKLEATVAGQRRLSYVQSIALAERSLLAGDSKRAQDILDALPPNVRRWEWHYLSRELSSENQSTQVPDEPTCLAVASGQVFVGGGLAGDHGSIWVAGEDQLESLTRLALPIDDEVVALEMSPDGQHTVFATREGTVQLVTMDGSATSAVASATEQVLDVAMNRNGQQIAYVQGDHTIHIVDGNTAVDRDGATRAGKLQLPAEGGSVWCLAFHPDGKQIVVGRAYGDVEYWDIESGTLGLTLVGHTGLIRAVAFNSIGDRMVSSSDDGTARIWDATSGEILGTLQGHTSFVTAAAFSRDDSRIVTSSVDQTVRLWDVGSLEELVVHRGHTGCVWDVAFGSRDQSVISVAVGGELKRWDASASGLERALDQTDRWIRDLSLSDDGSRAAVRLEDGVVEIWDARDDLRLCQLSETYADSAPWVFSGDGQFMMVQDYQSVVVHAATDGKQTSKVTVPYRPDSPITTSFDGSLIAYADGNGVVVREASTEQEIRRVHVAGEVIALALDRQAQRLGIIARQTSSETSQLLIAEVGDHSEVQTFTCHGDQLVFSPSGAVLATFGRSRWIDVWNLDSGTRQHRLDGGRCIIQAVVMSPDGRLFSSADNAVVTVWELDDGHEVLSLRDVPEPLDLLRLDREQTLIGMARSGVARRWKIASPDSPNRSSTNNELIPPPN